MQECDWPFDHPSGSGGRKNVMGNRVSRVVVGCFTPQREEKYAHGLHFSEPLDEGLGHSFCYVRPALDSPAVSPTHQEPGDSSPSAQELVLDSDTIESQIGVCSGELPNPEAQTAKTELELNSRSQAERPRVGWEKAERAKHNEKVKSLTETSFKAISGASVSANTATPRSIACQEQFNSFSNVPIERAAAFESTASFSALPLQRIANSGPMSGPASGPLDNRVFQSGPLERGFMSGPLERDFMSGPIERGFMSGPLEPVDRNTFSAPLAGPYPGRRKRSLKRFVRTMSGPMRKAIVKTVSKTTATLARTIVVPMRHFVMGGDAKDRDGDLPQSSIDSPMEMESSGSDVDNTEGNNLQWAQGKAGEDRVHVVLSEEHGWLFVGIYDGFNGPDAPDFLMSNLYPAIYRELKGLLWDQKGGFELPNGSPAEGGSSAAGRAQLGSSGGEEIPGGDFLARLGPASATSDSSEEPQLDFVSHQASSHGELTMPVMEGTREVETMGLEGKGCIGKLHPWPPPERNQPNETTVVDSTHDIRNNNLERPICEVEAMTSDGDGLQQQANSDSSAEAQVDTELKTTNNIIDEDLGLKQELKLIGDRLAMQDGPKQNVPTIISRVETPEPLGSSNVHFAEISQVKDSKIHNLKRVVHNRRQEQQRKYAQWRYEWELERLEEEARLKEKLRLEQEARETERSTVDHDAILRALSCALEATENAYLDMADRVLQENPELALMGSCVLVMLMKDEDVYILNVGDSRAVIAQDCRRGSFSSFPKLSRGQLNGQKLDEHERIGARDSLLRQELERIIEETPTELEALEASHDVSSFAPPPPGLSLLGALQLTSDHSTSIPEEVQRLRAEHPNDDDIISNDRVKGRLKVTRAFGAGFLKKAKWNDVLLEMFRCNFIGNDPYVTCNPFLHHHKLGPQDRFLVLSSDGLYQYLSNEEVVSHVEWFMEKFPEGDPAQHLIEELLHRAAKKNGLEFHELLDIPQGDRRKYHDDVSVMVISLEGRIWRSSG